MKKMLSLILAILMVTSIFAGCTQEQIPTTPSITDKPTVLPVLNTATPVTEPTAESTTEPIPEPTTEPATEPATEPEPTESEPTQPEPTEPEPTEPESTEPKPTEPKTTEPEPTESEPTESEPTESEPTEPKPTQPQPTEHKHDYKATVIAPTCEKSGCTQYECACGRAYRDNPTDPIGYHSYTTKTVAPTADADGYDEHTCIRCGKSYKTNYVSKTGDYTGYYWADCDNDGKSEWWPRNCKVEGHRYKNEVIQEATCCQPKIIDSRCTVVGCNHQQESYPHESWPVPHLGDAALASYKSVEAYTVRHRDGQAWVFDDEVSARAKAKQIADAYRNGESIHWVERIQSSGYTVVYPETFTCKTCGQTISYQEMKKDYRAGFTGTYPENPYEDRRWVEEYNKNNQP